MGEQIRGIGTWLPSASVEECCLHCIVQHCVLLSSGVKGDLGVSWLT